jgi:hypothetical protein
MYGGIMNRKQFAETVAQAYQDQYHWQEWRRRRVMNDPAIDYDISQETFGSCSTLTPTAGDEVRVLVLEDGMFGWHERSVTKRDIYQYLVDDASNDIWYDVTAQITQFYNDRCGE